MNRAELEAIVADKAAIDGPVKARFEPTSEPFRWMPREQAVEYFDATPGRELGT